MQTPKAVVYTTKLVKVIEQKHKHSIYYYLIIVDKERKLLLREKPCLADIHAIFSIEKLNHGTITVPDLKSLKNYHRSIK